MKDLRPTRAMSLALFGLGIALFVSPWLLGFPDERRAMLSACAIGGLSALIVVASGFRVRDWWAAGSLSLGAWTVAAPILFGFLDQLAATWTHVGAGLAMMTLAILTEDWRTRHRPRAGAGG